MDTIFESSADFMVELPIEITLIDVHLYHISKYCFPNNLFPEY